MNKGTITSRKKCKVKMRNETKPKIMGTNLHLSINTA